MKIVLQRFEILNFVEIYDMIIVLTFIFNVYIYDIHSIK